MPEALRVVVRAGLATALLAAVSGCGNVAPYQRSRLAHPTMNPADARSPGRAHMQAVQEGASGGDAAEASGCGCN